MQERKTNFQNKTIKKIAEGNIKLLQRNWPWNQVLNVIMNDHPKMWNHERKSLIHKLKHLDIYCQRYIK